MNNRHKSNLKMPFIFEGIEYLSPLKGNTPVPLSDGKGEGTLQSSFFGKGFQQQLNEAIRDRKSDKDDLADDKVGETVHLQKEKISRQEEYFERSGSESSSNRSESNNNRDQVSVRKSSVNESSLGEDFMSKAVNHPKKKPLVYFKKILKVVARLFIDLSVHEDSEDLNDIERKIIEAIVQRKLKPSDYKFNHTVSQVLRLQELKEKLKNPRRRRPEENYKFIMAMFLKFLRKSNNKSDLKCPIAQKEFYSLYFSDMISEKTPLEEFFFERRIGGKMKQNLRIGYFKTVFKSPSFRSAFVDFSKASLWERYQQKIYKKLTRMFKRLERQIESRKIDFEEAADFLIQDIQTNKKCKLPWTKFEVQSSLNKMNSLVELELVTLK